MQTAARPCGGFSLLDSYTPLGGTQTKLYYALREAVPIIDAAIFKIVRLTGGFELCCSDPRSQRMLDEFCKNVPVGGNRFGIEAFAESFLEQLLTCGTAAGEIVTDRDGRAAGLYNAPLENIELCRAEDGFGVEVCTREGAQLKKVERPELILLSVLNPEPGEAAGCSMLKGLPFVSSILLKIYESIGVNWERAGNVRFAVTYKPQNDAVDRAYAKERAMQVAKEWSEAMQPGGSVKDFVAVGDVQIKVIGADNQVLDSEIPVRQMLEQIVAKTGLPPFMLGLSWSSTERMSAQQSDVLTSELESYRRLMSPIILKIADTFLRREGCPCAVSIVWDDITLQDEVEMARAELYRAQAAKISAEKTEEE